MGRFCEQAVGPTRFCLEAYPSLDANTKNFQKDHVFLLRFDSPLRKIALIFFRCFSVFQYSIIPNNIFHGRCRGNSKSRIDHVYKISTNFQREFAFQGLVMLSCRTLGRSLFVGNWNALKMGKYGVRYTLLYGNFYICLFKAYFLQG